MGAIPFGGGLMSLEPRDHLQSGYESPVGRALAGVAVPHRQEDDAVAPMQARSEEVTVTDCRD